MSRPPADKKTLYYSLRIISKSVGVILRIQGFEDSSEMLKNFNELLGGNLFFLKAH
jgi:hypothetical protein